jgi:osmotically inducible lipoprotein OsmB
MLKIAKYTVLASALFAVAACGDTWGQRAVTGAGIGAGSGALLGVATGFNPLLGAVVGGAGGAAIGAATTPKQY